MTARTNKEGRKVLGWTHRPLKVQFERNMGRAAAE